MMKILWAIAIFLLLFHPLFAALKVGNKAPSFTSAATNGGEISPKSYKGKNPILLYFWDANFGICRNELKDLNAHYKEYANEGIKVFSVNINPSSNKKAIAIISSDKIAIPLLLDTNGKISSLYNIEGVVPTLYLIDKSGKISYECQGSFSVSNDLNPQVEKLSSPSAPTPQQGFEEIPGEKDENGGTIYLIPQTPLEITFPRGWLMKKLKKPSKTIHSFHYPGKHNKWKTLVIHLRKNVHWPPLLLLMNSIREMQKKYSDNFILISKPAPVPGLPGAISFTFGFTNKNSVQINQLVVLIPISLQRRVWFFYSAPANEFKAQSEEIWNLIDSVHPSPGHQ